MNFTELNLIKPLIQALDKKGYQQATPIQAQSIPHVLQGKDIFGCAQTGTGKTASFALPILQLLSARQKHNNNRGIKALILAPTRELALQISANIYEYGKHLGISHTTVYGGVPIRAQINELSKGIDILVATPGRLLDLVNQGYIKLNLVEFLVLDEADRMLDMGFINDVKKIIKLVPQKRQTLFFSATAAPDILKLANSILQNPVHVNVNPVSSTAPLIKQSVYYVAKENKKQLLSHILKSDTIESALIFTRTKHGANKVAKDLNKIGITAEAMHGNKSQNARQKALQGFKNKSIRVLVATDIASRGIDVDKLSHVINYEIPEQAETYVHRIGRTGRAGSEGTALSFCAKEEMGYLRDINKLINKQIDVVKSHPYLN